MAKVNGVKIIFQIMIGQTWREPFTTVKLVSVVFGLSSAVQRSEVAPPIPTGLLWNGLCRAHR